MNHDSDQNSAFLELTGRTKHCNHDNNRSVASGRDIYILATHIEKLFSASSLRKCLSLYQKQIKSQ